MSLFTQQFDYIKSQISPVQVKCPRGEDGVDCWTSQKDWDTVLKQVKIVVSTYQVLLDALSHGFVLMDFLALIVFDEGLFLCYHCSSLIIVYLLITGDSTQLCRQTPRSEGNEQFLPSSEISMLPCTTYPRTKCQPCHAIKSSVFGQD